VEGVSVNKVLVISYHFPPTGGAKTRRMLKFLKHLPSFSWKPIVLTAKNPRIFNFDPSLVKELPNGLEVHRATTVESLIHNTRSHPYVHQSNSEHSHDSPSKIKLWRAKLRRSFGRWISIPDAFISWVPFAVSLALKIRNKDAIDVVYATAPPFSNLIVATVLKKLTGLPVVYDFRDAWVSNPARKRKYPKLRRSLESLYESSVVRNADLILSTTAGIVDDFRTRYPHEAPAKFALLTNGYDTEDLASASPPREAPSDRMRLVHTGHLTAERSPRHFMQALGRLLQERPDAKHEIEVWFVGQNDPFLDGKRIEDYVTEYALESVVRLIQHVPRAEAWRYQMSADILLLFIGRVPEEQRLTYGVAGKVFDYMIAKKPVLGLADSGPVSQIIEETKIGEVIDPSDTESIKIYLEKSLDRFKRCELFVEPVHEQIRKYDVRALTERLAGLFDACRRTHDNKCYFFKKEEMSS
jgi:glycosyltransferase involved in cell wall biosynthesis